MKMMGTYPPHRHVKKYQQLKFAEKARFFGLFFNGEIVEFITPRVACGDSKKHI